MRQKRRTISGYTTRNEHELTGLSQLNDCPAWTDEIRRTTYVVSVDPRIIIRTNCNLQKQTLQCNANIKLKKNCPIKGEIYNCSRRKSPTSWPKKSQATALNSDG